MKNRIWLLFLCGVFTHPWLAVAQESGSLPARAALDHIRAQIAQRESLTPQTFWGAFERTDDIGNFRLPNGEAYLPEPGRRTRQQAHEFFWRSDVARAFAKTEPSEVSQDGEVLNNHPDSSTHEYTLIFDGRVGYRIFPKKDTSDSQKIVLRKNVALTDLGHLIGANPLLAGRGLAWDLLSDVLADAPDRQVSLAGYESLDGMECAKISIIYAPKGTRAYLWLAEKYEYCCVRYEASVPGSDKPSLVIDTTLERRNDGLIVPVKVKLQSAFGGNSVTEWKTLRFESSFDTSPPPYGFAPENHSFDEVQDATALNASNGQE